MLCRTHFYGWADCFLLLYFILRFFIQATECIQLYYIPLLSRRRKWPLRHTGQVGHTRYLILNLSQIFSTVPNISSAGPHSQPRLVMAQLVGGPLRFLGRGKLFGDTEVPIGWLIIDRSKLIIALVLIMIVFDQPLIGLCLHSSLLVRLTSALLIYRHRFLQGLQAFSLALRLFQTYLLLLNLK